MKRSELEHIIRAATTILQLDKVYVVGSQSILGTYTESQLPRRAYVSVEADIFTFGGQDAERMSEMLFSIGEMSAFHATHGIYVDGVSRNTAVLPNGWEDRVVALPAQQITGASVVGLCLDPHDLCISKIIANREKDLEFVRDLVEASLIDPAVLMDRLVDVAPPVDVLVIEGHEKRKERDINYAWVFVQTLADMARRLELPEESVGPTPPTRAGDLGATTNRGRYASRDHSGPDIAV